MDIAEAERKKLLHGTTSMTLTLRDFSNTRASLPESPCTVLVLGIAFTFRYIMHIFFGTQTIFYTNSNIKLDST